MNINFGYNINDLVTIKYLGISGHVKMLGYDDDRGNVYLIETQHRELWKKEEELQKYKDVDAIRAEIKEAEVNKSASWNC